MNNNEQEKILTEEKAILETEKDILQEIKKEKKEIMGLKKNIVVSGVVVALVIIAAAVTFIYLNTLGKQITIEKSVISAPQIDLSATTPGTLNEVYVNAGDQVLANTVLAKVGNQLIKAKTDGLIIDVKKDIGQLFGAGTPVISMIDPSELRVVGQVDENKGLSDIAIGQAVTFTVDAYGSQKFSGVVDEINQTSNSSGVAFSISDKREVKQFDVKVRFNTVAHPEFKNGMSAKITIYKN
ncbi:MAG: HlyD family efflux transporter periplasmic adaptor subunit [Candidatus Falkowbacteria bacterium]